MVSTDPIADMLSRIRNAMNVRKNTVDVPHSKMKESVVRILKENHFVTDYTVIDNEGAGKTMTVTINEPTENARITEIDRVSTPGRRAYTGADKIPVVMRGRGMVIMSTPQGVMSGADAKSKRLGGEIICKVY